VDAPEKVVCLFELRRHLERGDRGPERVEAAKDVRDSSVLAGRVDPLQYDEQRAASLSPETTLELVKAVPKWRGRLLGHGAIAWGTSE
jgi:hypothetical protein